MVCFVFCNIQRSSLVSMQQSGKESTHNNESVNEVVQHPDKTAAESGSIPANMTNHSDEGCELQQLVIDDDGGGQGRGTPPVSPKCQVTRASPKPNKTKKFLNNRHEYTRIPTCDGDDTQVTGQADMEGLPTISGTSVSQSTSQGTSQGSLTSRSLNRIATAPVMSTLAAGQNSRLLYVNEKLSRGPSVMSEHGGTRSSRDKAERGNQNARRAQIKRGVTSTGLANPGLYNPGLNHLLPSRSRLPGLDSRSQMRYRLRDPERSCQHHSFLTDVTDVHRMEEALLHLLEDFHSGKLRAFGKDCSMEQMTGIREQQERLARLHFDLGAQGELYSPLSDEGLRAGQENMQSLMGSLEQLSVSIERLHSFSESRESSQQPPDIN